MSSPGQASHTPAAHTEPALITVVIATHNRAARLRETLQDLAHQETDELFRYQVLVVNNNSSDATEQVLAELAASYPVPLTRLQEARQGKSYALNRGIEAAEGELVAFTDDDVRIGPAWLKTLYGALLRHQADGAGGAVRLLWHGERPVWLSDTIARQLGTAEHGDVAKLLDSPTQLVIGPNALYRRSLFVTYGGFNPADRAEDSAWCLKLLQRGHRVVYEPAAVVRHQIDAESVTVRSIARRLYLHGQSYGMRLPAEKRARMLCGVPVWVVRMFFGLHLNALRALCDGRVDEALTHWLLRSLYWGVMTERFGAWRGARLGRRAAAA